MNISYHFQGIEFEWDEEKAISNLNKHSISFETACEVFFDPFLHPVDERGNAGEIREAVIGLTMGWELLFVVYQERETRIRLISARWATNQERQNYENQ